MADWSDFPWRPGMANTYGWRVRTVRADGAAFGVDQFPTPSVRRFTGDDVPDLTDPATVGALAGAVREAWGQPAWFCRRFGRASGFMWWVCDAEGESVLVRARYLSGGTEAEAWLAAWHARPKEGA